MLSTTVLSKKKKKKDKCLYRQIGMVTGPGEEQAGPQCWRGAPSESRAADPSPLDLLPVGNIAQDQNQQDSLIPSLISTYELRRGFQDGAGGSSKPGL